MTARAPGRLVGRYSVVVGCPALSIARVQARRRDRRKSRDAGRRRGDGASRRSPAARDRRRCPRVAEDRADRRQGASEGPGQVRERVPPQRGGATQRHRRPRPGRVCGRSARRGTGPAPGVRGNRSARPHVVAGCAGIGARWLRLSTLPQHDYAVRRRLPHSARIPLHAIAVMARRQLDALNLGVQRLATRSWRADRHRRMPESQSMTLVLDASPSTWRHAVAPATLRQFAAVAFGRRQQAACGQDDDFLLPDSSPTDGFIAPHRETMTARFAQILRCRRGPAAPPRRCGRAGDGQPFVERLALPWPRWTQRSRLARSRVKRARAGAGAAQRAGPARPAPTLGERFEAWRPVVPYSRAACCGREAGISRRDRESAPECCTSSARFQSCGPGSLPALLARSCVETQRLASSASQAARGRHRPAAFLPFSRRRGFRSALHRRLHEREHAG